MWSSIVFTATHNDCVGASPHKHGRKDLQSRGEAMLLSRISTGRLCLVGKTRVYGFCGTVRAISTSRSRSTLSLQPHDVKAVQTRLGFFEIFHLLYRKGEQ